jgi:hypothetical protein
MTHTESVAIDSALLVESPAAPLPTAAERLQASREALQAWIRMTYHPEDINTRRREQVDGPRDPGWLGVLADSITEVPMATVAARWLKGWWARHPLRATTEFAEVAADELIGPVARRHPWMVLVGAAAAGAMAVRLRPWRWVSTDTVIASLLPTVSVASILHWVTTSLQRFHPRDDVPASAPPLGDATGTEAPIAPAAQRHSPAAAPIMPQAATPRHAHDALHPEPALP